MDATMNGINNQAMIEDIEEYMDDCREEDVNEGKDEGEVEDEGEDASPVEAKKIPKLKAKDALKKSLDGLPTMNAASLKMLERFAATTPTFFQTNCCSMQRFVWKKVGVVFNEGGDGDELILSPTYVPILRDRVEGQVQEGGGPTRGTPTTSEAITQECRAFLSNRFTGQ